jgi:uncharacterized glyoxalase superfamily protein PhnB
MKPRLTLITLGVDNLERALAFYRDEEVDAVMAQATTAGATIVKPAGDTFWGGYAGYFQDPDGHLWEVAWNPQMEIAE